MSKVVGWTIVLAFIATTAVTLLAIVGVLRIEPQYLDKLFIALVLEIIAAGFFLFRQGLNPEQRYFREATALLQEAKTARAAGRVEEADQVLGRILRLSPDGLPFDVRQVFRERGEIASSRSDWDASVRSHAVYLEIQPDDVDALVRYGRALREMGRYQVALQAYESAQRLAPSNYDVLNGLQNINRRLGAFALDADRPDVADSYFERTRTLINSMLTLVPSRAAHEKRYLNAVLARARLQWEWRRYPAAVAAYEQVLAEFPDRADIREDLAAVTFPPAWDPLEVRELASLEGGRDAEEASHGGADHWSAAAGRGGAGAGPEGGGDLPWPRRIRGQLLPLAS